MTWWDKLKKVLASEARDAKVELDRLRDVVDEELTRKEREISATPTERIDMILEDIEADHGRLEEIERNLGTDRPPPDRPRESREPSDSPGVEVPDVPIVSPTPTPAPARRARLLGPADVPANPRLPEVLEWVSVVLVDPQVADDTPPGFDHEVRIDAQAPFEEGRLAESMSAAGAHPLILEVMQTGRGIGFVKAPGLASDDVRLVVASALAAQMSDEGKE